VKSNALGALGIALVLIGWLAPQTQAVWVRLQESATQSTFIDSASVKSVGPHRFAVWLKVELPKPKKSPDGHSYVKMLARAEWDCEASNSRTLSVVYYDAKGNVVQSHSDNPVLVDWEPVVPESLGSAIIGWVCKSFDTP
jgi:hypothetical protein